MSMEKTTLDSLRHPDISPSDVVDIRETLEQGKLFLKIPVELTSTYQAYRHRDLERYIHLGAPPLFLLVIGLIGLNTLFYWDTLQRANQGLWFAGSLFVIACVGLGIAAVWSSWGRRHYSNVVTVPATLVLAKLAAFPSAFDTPVLGMIESYFCVLAVIVTVLALRLPFRNIVIALLASTALVFLLDQLVVSYHLNVISLLYYFGFVAFVCLFIAWQLEEREKTEFLQWLLIGYNMRVNEELQDKLKAQANRDSLTQIANRRAFDKALENEWNRLRRQQRPLALLYMDIDYFKPFNDTYGHDAGDNCLKQVAAQIQAVLGRPSDLAARIGGEEFVVLLPDTDAEGALVIAANIQAELAQQAIPHESSQVSNLVTLSIGVASQVPDSQSKPKALLKAADAALYQAKASGRNRVQLATGLARTAGPI